MPIELLQKDSEVCAANGRTVRIAEIVVWEKTPREIVELRVDSMRLCVTSSHRVVVPGEH